MRIPAIRESAVWLDGKRRNAADGMVG